jgi:serine/threonine-protein kinase
MAVTNADLVGQQLGDGRYTITSRLDKGSMGYVYLANDSRLEAVVVVKVPKVARLEDPEFRVRFERESRFLVKLSHPHIIRIIDVGTQDNVPYYVMQYVSGGSLRDRMMGGSDVISPMPARTIKNWLQPVAKALDFMYSQGCVHRDVKPANILFDEHDNSYLSDFGLSKILADSQGLVANTSHETSAGAVVGTPNYVAPEIVLGRKYDGRADQYSLATTLYEVLAGKAPLEGPTASATMVNQTSKIPVPLVNIISGCPQELSDAIQKGMAKDPNKRFASCEEMANTIIASFSKKPTSNPVIQTSSNKSSLRNSNMSTITSAASNTTRWNIVKISRGQKGKVPCPSCGMTLMLMPVHARQKATCKHCQAKLAVGENLAELALLKKNESFGTGNARSDSSISNSDHNEFTMVLGQEVFGYHLTAQHAMILAGTMFVLIMGMAMYFGYRYARQDIEEKELVRAFTQTTNRENLATDKSNPNTATAPVAAVVNNSPVAFAIDDINDIIKNELRQKLLSGLNGEGFPVNFININSMAFVKTSASGISSTSSVAFEGWIPETEQDRYLLLTNTVVADTKAEIYKTYPWYSSPLVCLLPADKAIALNGNNSQVSILKIMDTAQNEKGWDLYKPEANWGRMKVALPAFQEYGQTLLPLISIACDFHLTQNLKVANIQDEKFVGYIQKLNQVLIRPSQFHANPYQALCDEVMVHGQSKADVLILPEQLALANYELIKSRWGSVRMLYLTPNANVMKTVQVLNYPGIDQNLRNQAMVLGSRVQTPYFQEFVASQGFRPHITGHKSLTELNPKFVEAQAIGFELTVPEPLPIPSNEVLITIKRLIQSQLPK